MDDPGKDQEAARSKKRFEELSRLHAERARRFVRLKLGAALRRRMDSQDVLQEVLLEATQLFPKKNQGAALKDDEFFPWLQKIIEHKIKNLARFHVGAVRRSVQREVSLQTDESSLKLPQKGRTPSAELVEREGAERLRRAIELLSPRERQVVTLVHLHRLRVSEAARRLEKTPNATSVLLHQALAKLRGILKGKEH